MYYFQTNQIELKINNKVNSINKLSNFKLKLKEYKNNKLYDQTHGQFLGI